MGIDHNIKLQSIAPTRAHNRDGHGQIHDIPNEASPIATEATHDASMEIAPEPAIRTRRLEASDQTAKRVKEDRSWITQARLDTKEGGDKHRVQHFALYDPCLSVSIDADDSTDDSADERANMSTDRGIQVRKLARNIEAAEREQEQINVFSSQNARETCRARF